MDNKKRGGNESTVAMVFASQVSTVLGILISAVACFILLLMLDPHAILHGTPERIMHGNPPAAIAGKSGGLVFKIFFAATIICFFGGAIAGITIPFYTKHNQTKDTKEPTPLQQKKGVKNAVK